MIQYYRGQEHYRGCNPEMRVQKSDLYDRLHQGVFRSCSLLFCAVNSCVYLCIYLLVYIFFFLAFSILQRGVLKSSRQAFYITNTFVCDFFLECIHLALCISQRGMFKLSRQRFCPANLLIYLCLDLFVHVCTRLKLYISLRDVLKSSRQAFYVVNSFFSRYCFQCILRALFELYSFHSEAYSSQAGRLSDPVHLFIYLCIHLFMYLCFVFKLSLSLRGVLKSSRHAFSIVNLFFCWSFLSQNSCSYTNFAARRVQAKQAGILPSKWICLSVYLIIHLFMYSLKMIHFPARWAQV